MAKKIEKSLVNGVDPKELGLRLKRRHEERLKEIEKVKMQREQRDRERMEKEEEREIMQREEALIEAVELEKKEEEFHLQQAKVRSEIRVREGRARAIDLVSRNLHSEDGDEFDESVHPLAIFDGLTLSEMDELLNDVKTYLDLDHKDERHKAFWANMLVVANAELDEARRRDEYERARSRGEEAFGAMMPNQGVHESVEGDVREMLEGKTRVELEELEGDVERQLATGEESEYWIAVLQRVKVHKARTWVDDVDAGLRSKRAARAPRDVPPPPPMAAKDAPPADDSDDEDLLGADFGKAAADAGNASDYENEDGGFSPRAVSPEPMSPAGGTPREGTPTRSFSPEAIRAREDEPDYLDVVDEDEDRRELERLRALQRAKKLGRFKEAAGPGATAGATERATFDAFKEGAQEAAAMSGAVIQNLTADAGEAVEAARAKEEANARASRALAERMMGDGAGEVAFAGEAPLESQVYWWHDKYRPRKPKYFNRVHTGYEWNKYNQTHYDHDNPPPKTVQGTSSTSSTPISSTSPRLRRTPSCRTGASTARRASSASTPVPRTRTLRSRSSTRSGSTRRRKGFGARSSAASSTSTSISSARGTGVSETGSSLCNETNASNIPNQTQCSCGQKTSLRGGGFLVLWATPARGRPRSRCRRLKYSYITRRTTPLRYLPEAASLLLASSRAHSEPLVSGLALRPNTRMAPTAAMVAYQGASQSSHLRDWPGGGGVSLKSLPLTWPSPCTPSAKYPPGGPAPMRRCCWRCTPRTALAANPRSPDCIFALP